MASSCLAAVVEQSPHRAIGDEDRWCIAEAAAKAMPNLCKTAPSSHQHTVFIVIFRT
jgi:hypothetical protein